MNIKKESKRETSNLLDEIHSIVVVEIVVFFVLLNKELPNNSTSENPESFKLKLLLAMLRMLFMRINLSSEKRGQ